MKIGKLSEITGASVRSLRHYENKKIISSYRMENGYRDFDDSMVERVKTIQFFLGLGLNTDQIREIVVCKDENPNPEMDSLCEDLLQTYQKKLDEINGQIDTLMMVKQKIEEQVSTFKSRKASHERGAK